MSTSKTELGKIERQRLFEEAEVLGKATVRGELLDLGEYPGFVTTIELEKQVHGEILALQDPRKTFEWLDEYECVAKNADKKGEYRREVLTAETESGETVQAWVYVFQGSSLDSRVIPEGIWTPGYL